LGIDSAVNKQHILHEIRRTAAENGGTPLGWRKFFSETGIRETDWLGKYWPRWSEALREAGFAPNQLTSAYEDAELIERYVAVIRKLGRLPASADLRMETRSDPTFPSDKTFTRLGSKAELVSKVLDYCRSREGFEDVAALCTAYQPRVRTSGHQAPQPETEIGFVYLMKSGRFYKIGRTNAAGRREREVALQLPEKTKTVHVIRTDDPVGIEAYWHTRFALKHKNGEWFDLDAADIAVFKRRKFM
jgi:hypothetical protein